MARLDFDFHASGPRRSLFGVLLALAGAAAFAWSAQAWQAARDAQAGLELRIAALDTAARPVAATRLSPATQAGEAARQRVSAQLAYRWQPAFSALAGARDKRIALLALDAVQAKSQIKLVAEARTLEDVLAWIGRLQRQPGVKRAVLVQHDVQADAESQPVRVVVHVELGA